jgi:F-type H+-transporting ATPase subunit b
MLALIAPIAAEKGGGNFLVRPGVGLMIWTLIAFFVTFWLLRRLAFPRIQEALDRRANAIQESIEQAERMRKEADDLLDEYRQRLKEARQQSEEIVARARKAAENLEREGTEEARRRREELLAQARRDIEAETRRAIQEIRKEVADMTVLATEKLTRKSLTEDDQRQLVDETLSELDFSALAGDGDGRAGEGDGREG